MAKFTAKTKTISVKPTFNYSSPVPTHLKSDGRYPRNPNAVPGKKGVTVKKSVGPDYSRGKNFLGANTMTYKPPKEGVDYPKYTKPNKSVTKTTSKTTPTTSSPRGHYATRMAQGLLNRPTSDAARKKLYNK